VVLDTSIIAELAADARRVRLWREERYEHLPFFYSDLFDLGYEAVGALDARLETVESWKTPFREGVVHSLDGDQVRGVLRWGMFGHVDAARALIEGAAAGPAVGARQRDRVSDSSYFDVPLVMPTS
jgi:3-phenylpropionate/trans-cinnamate dioxygenase ferredoxin reductase subunit